MTPLLDPLRYNATNTHQTRFSNSWLFLETPPSVLECICDQGPREYQIETIASMNKRIMLVSSPIYTRLASIQSPNLFQQIDVFSTGLDQHFARDKKDP